MKRSIGKLHLARETLRTLTPSSMSAAVGGFTTVRVIRTADCEEQPISKTCPETWTCRCSLDCPDPTENVLP